MGNLEEHISLKELRALFARAGRVISLEIIRDPVTRHSRGYGFVEMATQKDSARAITLLNGLQVNYRPLVVKRARTTAGVVRPKGPARQRHNG